MAEMKIITQKIERIEEHPNADRLEIAFTDVFDWPVIIGKDSFDIGEYVIHFPVDCVVSQEIEELLLGNSKLKLKNGRIRAAKIRGTVSYGILAPFPIIANEYKIKINSDNLMSTLDCKKYEPPVKIQNNKGAGKGKKSWKRDNRNFDKYFNMNHLQNCKGVFDDEDEVVVSEKLHGTSFRAGWIERDNITFWEKIKAKIVSLWRDDYHWEFVFGSRNVQLQTNKIKKTFYTENMYAKMVKKYKLKNLPRIIIYGEIVGPGIQKNYQYTKGHQLFIYDIKLAGEYIDFGTRQELIHSFKLVSVPLLEQRAKWGDIKNNLMKYFSFPSRLDATQNIIEGIVIESLTETINRHGRKKVKLLNPKYLLNKTNTDFH